MRNILKKTLFMLSLVICSFMIIQTIHAANIRSPDGELVPIWDKLDAARSYREDWHCGISKTHSQLIDAYKNMLVPGYEPTSTPQELFIEAANEFRGFLDAPIWQEEAIWGLQEALNEYMTGQLLIGNDYLIKGLRVRFPSAGGPDDPNDPDDPDQLTLLSDSSQAFQNGIDQIVEDLRKDPDGMRSGGTVIPQFPFYVENTIKEGQGQGGVVENELYRFTNLVERCAMADNCKGKRMFFFDNVEDVDNFPYGNFLGPEDLDLNDNGIKDSAGRDDAARQFKRSAHATYLHTAVLAEVQIENDFDQNNGYTLKRQILDAQRIFDDILAGFNPLQLLGDFVPHQPVENYLREARVLVSSAIDAEKYAKDASRTYDHDETALRQTLESQQLTYLNSIEGLTGLIVQGQYNLLEREDRERLFADADENARNGLGQMGLQCLVIEDAAIAAQQAYETLQQIPEKIRIEEERNGQIATLITKNGYIFAVLSVAETVYSSVNVSFGTSSGVPTTSVSFNPCVVQLALVRGARDILSAIQQAEIRNIDSAAIVKQLLLDQALALISVQRAGNIIEQEKARLEELRAELQRTVRNYITARSDLASAYFINPAYRLDRDQLIEAAEVSFESAMVECYYAAKALEYLWGEKFNNPVPLRSGGTGLALPLIYAPYVRAESIFSVKFAEAKIPNLEGFLNALSSWDLKMRDLRGSDGQISNVTISIRKDILGYTGLDEDYNRLLFKDFIAKHRVEGLNLDNPGLCFEFALEIADAKLFDTDHPNIKIEEIRINLISSPARSIAGLGTTSDPVRVNLTMLDEANVRTFFAYFPADDDILTYDLEEGRILAKSPFFATVDATIDGHSYPAAVPNTQLAGHSPAVTRWTLWMKMDSGNNRYLMLEHLDDIKIQITYHFGKPLQVTFP